MEWYRLFVTKPGHCELVQTQIQSLLVMFHFPYWQLLAFATNSAFVCRLNTHKLQIMHNANPQIIPHFSSMAIVFFPQNKAASTPQMPLLKYAIENKQFWIVWIETQLGSRQFALY